MIRHLSPRSRAALGCVVVVVLVVALGIGIALGRATSGHAGAAATTSAPSSQAAAPPTAIVGATRVVAGVPEGFADTRDGATGAAVAILSVEAGDLMAQPDPYRAAWREMCTPTYYETAGRAAAETVLAAQQSDNHLISNAAAGQHVYEHDFPLRVVVLTYTDVIATLRTWSLVVAHPGDGPTVVSFNAGTLQLRWSGTDWKLDGGGSSAAAADGASGPMLLDGGPQLPAYLGDPASGIGGSSNG